MGLRGRVHDRPRRSGRRRCGACTTRPRLAARSTSSLDVHDPGGERSRAAPRSGRECSRGCSGGGNAVHAHRRTPLIPRRRRRQGGKTRARHDAERVRGGVRGGGVDDRSMDPACFQPASAERDSGYADRAVRVAPCQQSATSQRRWRYVASPRVRRRGGDFTRRPATLIATGERNRLCESGHRIRDASLVHCPLARYGHTRLLRAPRRQDMVCPRQHAHRLRGALRCMPGIARSDRPGTRTTRRVHAVSELRRQQRMGPGRSRRQRIESVAVPLIRHAQHVHRRRSHRRCPVVHP